MKILSRHALMVLLLALLFFAPGITALYFYQHPQWLSGHTTNKGNFVSPPLQISSLNMSRTSIKLTPNVPKWHMVLWRPDECDEACLTLLEQLARVRLALGRRYYDVEEVLLMGELSKPLSSEFKAKLREQAIELVYLPQKESSVLSKVSSDQRIFIANPQGFLVLSYAVPAESDDIYHDIKQLLTTTQTKSE